MSDNPVVAGMQALEQDKALDRWVDALSPVLDRLEADDALRTLLQGEAAGHALHPALVVVPQGTWLSASALDLLGGPQSRDAARTLTGLGILAAIPAIATGLAELASASQEERRVGVVHATANATALLLQVCSWRQRGKDHHGRGAALGLLGNSVAGAAGYLGGHLAVGRKVGSRHRDLR